MGLAAVVAREAAARIVAFARLNRPICLNLRGFCRLPGTKANHAVKADAIDADETYREYDSNTRPATLKIPIPLWLDDFFRKHSIQYALSEKIRLEKLPPFKGKDLASDFERILREYGILKLFVAFCSRQQRLELGGYRDNMCTSMR